MTELTPYHEDQELDNNTSDNVHFRDILEQRMTRRSLIGKTASGAVTIAWHPHRTLFHMKEGGSDVRWLFLFRKHMRRRVLVVH